MIQTKDVLELIDDVFPFCLAEPWDNCGLQAGEGSWPVHRILVGLDVSMGLLEDAVKWDANMVLTHHPLIMNAKKQWDFEDMPGSAVAFSAKKQISIVSVHTNLDKAWQGLNDYVAEKIGLRVESVLLQDPSLQPKTSQSGKLTGLGRICTLFRPQKVTDFISHIKKTLGLSNVLLIGNSCHEIQTAALCTGSGGSLVDVFLSSGTDLYITGDLKYHEARAIEEHGKIALDIGHFGSEIVAVDLLVKKIGQYAAQKGYSIQIKGYTGEKDPFIIA